MHELPALPYAEDALAPNISAETISFHYGKHHKAYVDNTNKLIAGTELEKLPLVELIKVAAADPSKKGLFNNSAQIWNHDFYWHSMKPKGGGKPTGKLAEAIDRDFGGLDKFYEEFKTKGAGQFGSGYVWLVSSGGVLKVIGTANAETPITTADVPILTSDVWEHTYYIDYRNRRPDYLTTFVNELINWDFAEENFAKL